MICMLPRKSALLLTSISADEMSRDLQVWQLSAQEHVLLVVHHHSITDGVSLHVLARDLAAAYSAALSSSQPHWPQLSVQYIDYAAWQRQQLTGDVLDAELAWWRQTLAGAPALLELPADRPRPSVMSFAGAEACFRTTAAVRHSLRQLATAHKTTVFVVVLAALQVRMGVDCLKF